MSSRIASLSAASVGEIATCLLMWVSSLGIRTLEARVEIVTNPGSKAPPNLPSRAQKGRLTWYSRQSYAFKNCPRLDEGLDAVLAIFTADARILETAPRRLGIICHAVDDDPTGP